MIKQQQSVNSEIRDLHESHSDDRRELERISSDLIRDLKLRYLMIDNFIPEYEKTRFLRKVYYDENDQEWHRKSELMNQSTVSEEEPTRPWTASSSSSSSIYLDRQSIFQNEEKLLNPHFSVAFHRNAIDELGLYMPESTTSNYLGHVDDDDDDDGGDAEADNENVQIEIL